jgi:hypothetical protein
MQSKSIGPGLVQVLLVSGTPQTVMLSCDGLPTDAACSFMPDGGVPEFHSHLTITTALSTPIGSYQVTVVGKTVSGQIVRTDQLMLTVLPFLPTVKYTLTISVSAPNCPSCTTDPTPGTYQYDSGSIQDVYAIHGIGWTVSWSVDGGPSGQGCGMVGGDVCEVTMDGNHMLVATFVSGTSTSTTTITSTIPPRISSAQPSILVAVNNFVKWLVCLFGYCPSD